MRDIKFELVGRNVKFDEIWKDVVTLQQLIDGNYNRSTMQTFFDTNNGNCDFIAARQWTGLKDKNGVEIYEGDIVKHNSGWGRDGTQTIVEYTERGEYTPYGTNDASLEGKESEVIGNIYENPELL